MAHMYPTGHLSLPAGNTTIYNQYAVFKGQKGWYCSDVGAPTSFCVITEAGRKKGSSSPPRVWACPQPILPSCFRHCLSLFRRSLSLLREGMLRKTLSVSHHRIGSETHARDKTFMPNTAQSHFKISHTQQSKTGKAQFHFPTTIQKEAKPSRDTGCFRLKEGSWRALLSSAVCGASPVLALSIAQQLPEAISPMSGLPWECPNPGKVWSLMCRGSSMTRVTE